LPFVASEEEIRAAFVDCGTIENVRLVRDPKTHIGKGIGYIMFSTKEEMLGALTKKKGMKFKHRELRINRAVEPKRREKKKNRQAAALEDRRERRREREAEDNGKGKGDDDVLPPKNFGDYSSEDSDDEKMIKRKAQRTISLEGTSFGKKPDRKSDVDAKREITLNNDHAIARKKKIALLSNMI